MFINDTRNYIIAFCIYFVITLGIFIQGNKYALINTDVFLFKLRIDRIEYLSIANDHVYLFHILAFHQVRQEC